MPRPKFTRIPRNCARCGVAFEVTQRQAERGWGIFCSKSCAVRTMQEAKHPPRICVCRQCGISFKKKPSHAGLLCSNECRYADQKVRPRATAEERFWSKVRKTETCWLWIGATGPWGHGHFLLPPDENGKKRFEKAHRFSWKIHRGPIPEGMEACHNCPGGDNPRCVNPDHLFLGTHHENMLDALKKGRTACGERLPHAKLTADDVRAIRVRYAAGGIFCREIAQDYGVSKGTIECVVARKTWRHI